MLAVTGTFSRAAPAAAAAGRVEGGSMGLAGHVSKGVVWHMITACDSGMAGHVSKGVAWHMR